MISVAPGANGASSRSAWDSAAAAPFAREVEALRAAIRSEGGANLAREGAIAELAAHALGGAPTAAGLGASFDDMALAVIRADGAAEEQGWVEATIGRLRRIVTVRRVGGDVAGNTAEAIVARTEAHLEAGDLAAAVTEIEALDGPPAEVAASWLGQARARRAADAALATLDANAIAAMGGG